MSGRARPKISISGFVATDDEYRMICERAAAAGASSCIARLAGEDEIELELHFPVRNFERIRRITGYLVGTLERFNNAKRAEERDRVKHRIKRDDQQ